ncbi:MAG: hydrogenase expression/formation protein HypE [Candidatus Fischerbacteria bacterium RBG_13_37_8]|uniref:Hydrogenase expression/formation protein HypE n=1 Tax=Candidatus Fischerbacteria bacterium RBG_13_37_8 TaxID=1817863 RepID=A0A1F5VXD8_9BACT|nr:MAG: hydrogenase expression/formation protein HypE [Candidatus Fischerbacteria bacterium RBG_13_37_8]
MEEAVKEIIRLGHGSGGRLTNELIHKTIKKYLTNDILDKFLDSAVLVMPDSKVVFTTDSYTVKPLFFPGGDIGKLAINGTVNDLVMLGAVPLYLSLGLIIEEGFLMGDFEKILQSIADAARLCNVKIVTGDTKVVDKGKGDGIYINTSGVGHLINDFAVDIAGICPGDKVLVNGYIGDHGAAIICARGIIEFESRVESDCAGLQSMVKELLEAGVKIKFMRDPTRGGLATVLTELGEHLPYSIVIEEEVIPVREEVKSICEFIGFDPLYLANEGKMVAVVAGSDTEKALEIMKRNPLGKEARIIGQIEKGRERKVLMKTVIGATRIVEMMLEDQLPRIC